MHSCAEIIECDGPILLPYNADLKALIWIQYYSGTIWLNVKIPMEVPAWAKHFLILSFHL